MRVKLKAAAILLLALLLQVQSLRAEPPDLYFTEEVNYNTGPGAPSRDVVAHPRGKLIRISSITSDLKGHTPPPAGASSEWMSMWTHSTKYSMGVAVLALSDAEGHVIGAAFSGGEGWPYLSYIGVLESNRWAYLGRKFYQEDSATPPPGKKTDILPELLKYSQLDYLDLFGLDREVLDRRLWPRFSNLWYLGMPKDCTDIDLWGLSKVGALRHLNLRGTKVEGWGLEFLAGCDNLRTLDLRGCNLDSTNLKKLAKIKNLTTLMLSKGRHRFDTDAKFDEKDLALMVNCQNLKALRLDGIEITIPTLDRIAQSKSLEYLSLIDTTIPPNYKPPNSIALALDFQPIITSEKHCAWSRRVSAIRGSTFSLSYEINDIEKVVKIQPTNARRRELLTFLYLYLHYFPTPDSIKSAEPYSHQAIVAMKMRQENELDERTIAEAKTRVQALIRQAQAEPVFVNKRCKHLPLYQY